VPGSGLSVRGPEDAIPRGGSSPRRTALPRHGRNRIDPLPCNSSLLALRRLCMRRKVTSAYEGKTIVGCNPFHPVRVRPVCAAASICSRIPMMRQAHRYCVQDAEAVSLPMVSFAIVSSSMR
jgi:hypothetical protein